MTTDYWFKQSDQPLFEELLWDKPENKSQAGKLLIIGGNSHMFNAPAHAFQQAQEVGIGVCKVLLPEALAKIIGNHLENAVFAPSNKSGSFSTPSLATWLEFGSWADGVLLPGDISHNSETTVVLEQFINKYPGFLTLAGDALDAIIPKPKYLLARQKTTIVLNFTQLQKLGVNSHFNQAFTHNLPIASLIEILHNFTSLFLVNLILNYNNIYFVASNGLVSTSKSHQTDTNWQILVATNASVWSLQNPSKTFEALTTSLINI